MVKMARISKGRSIASIRRSLRPVSCLELVHRWVIA